MPRAVRILLAFGLVALAMVVLHRVVLSTTAGTAVLHGARPTILATKTICPTHTPRFIPAGLKPVDRELVSFGRTLAGVERRWGGPKENRWLLVVDGGFVDDITEAYDALAPDTSATVNGRRAEVLSTTFLDQTIQVAYWREAGAAPPCDVHAITASGLSRAEFSQVLADLK